MNTSYKQLEVNVSEDDIDDFNEKSAALRGQQRHAELRGRRAQERKTWESWRAGGKKMDDPQLSQLLESIDPIIQREATRRVQGLGGRIGHTTLKNELRNHAVTALHSYDPTKGTQLSTHIHQNFMRVTDFVAANRNTRRMPRTKVERYGTFNNAREEFKNQFGRDPTTIELKQMLPSWSLKAIQEMEKGFGAEVFSGVSALEGDVAEEDFTRGNFLMHKALMTQEEQRFGDMHFPPAGKKQMSVKAIARAMGIPEHKAYRIKTRVEKRLSATAKNR